MIIAILHVAVTLRLPLLFSIVASVEPLSCTLYNHVSNMPPQIYEDGTAFCSWRRQVCQFMCAWIHTGFI